MEVKEPAPAPKPKGRSSLFSLSAARSGSYADTIVESSKRDESDKSLPIDPAAEQKLEAVRGDILNFINNWRPRFISAFEGLTISGNTLAIVAPAASLVAEIEQCRVELLLKVRDMAAVDGYIELKVTLDESQQSKKIIKLEDRVAHFGSHAMVVKLKEALDLVVDG